MRAPEKSSDREGELWGNSWGFPDPEAQTQGTVRTVAFEAAVGPEQGCPDTAGGPKGLFVPLRSLGFTLRVVGSSKVCSHRSNMARFCAFCF